VSKDAKSLISSLLTVNASNRLSADAALKNGWITAGDDFLISQDLGVNLKEFKKFNAKRKFKAAVSTIMAAQKLTSLGLEFKKNLD
jgi:calcium/calmodulin-dependent protein kinase I